MLDLTPAKPNNSVLVGNQSVGEWPWTFDTEVANLTTSHEIQPTTSAHGKYPCTRHRTREQTV